MQLPPTTLSARPCRRRPRPCRTAAHSVEWWCSCRSTVAWAGTSRAARDRRLPSRALAGVCSSSWCRQRFSCTPRPGSSRRRATRSRARPEPRTSPEGCGRSRRGSPTRLRLPRSRSVLAPRPRSVGRLVREPPRRSQGRDHGHMPRPAQLLGTAALHALADDDRAGAPSTLGGAQ